MLGGLGAARIGSEEWEKGMVKYKRMVKYGKYASKRNALGNVKQRIIRIQDKY